MHPVRCTVGPCSEGCRTRDWHAFAICRLPFAATSSVCSLCCMFRLCCFTIFSLIIVFVQPVSWVANMRKAAPVCFCASHRRSGGVLEADHAAFAYSGGGSLVSVCIICLLLGVVRAKFRSFLVSPLDLPPPLHTFVICPCLLHLEHVTSSRFILHMFCLCAPPHQ